MVVKGGALWGLSYKELIPSWGLHPMTSAPPKGLISPYHDVGVRIQLVNFGGHRLSARNRGQTQSLFLRPGGCVLRPVHAVLAFHCSGTGRRCHWPCLPFMKPRIAWYLQFVGSYSQLQAWKHDGHSMGAERGHRVAVSPETSDSGMRVAPRDGCAVETWWPLGGRVGADGCRPCSSCPFIPSDQHRL